MARSWRLAFCVLLISLCVCCAIYPQQKQRMKEQQAGISTRIRVTLGEGHVLLEPEETFGRGRIKREATDCPVSETQDVRGLQRIIDANAETTYTFFIQPQPGFNKLVFRAKVNNKFVPGPWRFSKESLVVRSSQINIDWTHPTWIPVKIEYFKAARFGPDRHALRVKVGRNVNDELITRRWISHSYEGFAVDAEGPLKFLLNCNSWGVVPESLVDREEIGRTLLIVCVLAGCFLLVVGAATLYLLIARRSHPRRDNQSDLPLVPTSLLQEHRVNRDGGSDHIYEAIDKGTLAKFRQNLDSNSLAVGWTQRINDHSGSLAKGCENIKNSLDLTVLKPRGSSGIPSGDGRNMQEISLVEQKEATRECFGLDSPLESHYVEMHGIVSRTSSLNK